MSVIKTITFDQSKAVTYCYAKVSFDWAVRPGRVGNAPKVIGYAAQCA